MTLMEFIGCGLIGFGPPVILFIASISNDPFFIIVCVASAFFWILSLLISAAWWMIVFPLKQYPAFGMIFSVLFQEVFRFLFYLLMRASEKGLRQVWAMDKSHSSIMSGNKLSFVAGLGFGIMSCTFSLVNLLAAVYGPGTAGLNGHTSDFFLSSAFLSMCFFFLHTFWNVIFFHGFYKKIYRYPVSVVAMHLTLSCVTLMNSSIGPGLSLGVAFGLLFGSMYWAYIVVGGSNLQLVYSCKCW